MVIFPLNQEEKTRLQKLDKAIIFALKKLFLNVCVSNPPSNEAIKKVTDAFYDLESIQPDITKKQNEDNVI